MSIKSLVAAFLAAPSLFVVAYEDIHHIHRRTDYASVPPCTYPYTSFDYVGCYISALNPPALAFNPQLNFAAMTVELCTASCKSNGFRYAGVDYHGNCRCGDNIVGAATTQDQCSFACTGNSSEICGGLNRVSVYVDPTFGPSDPQTIADYQSLGCYTEGFSGRAVFYKQNSFDPSTLTTEICLQACKVQNYPLAATEFSRECYCGVVLGNGSIPAPASQCNKPCAGNAAQFCGGASRINLYQAADLQEAAPCGPQVQPPPSVTTSASIQSTSTFTSSGSLTATTLSTFTIISSGISSSTAESLSSSSSVYYTPTVISSPTDIASTSQSSSIYTPPVVSSSTATISTPESFSSISVYYTPTVILSLTDTASTSQSSSIYTPPVVSSSTATVSTPESSSSSSGEVSSSTDINTPTFPSSTSTYTAPVISSSTSIYTPPVISSSTAITSFPESFSSSSSVYNSPSVVSSSTSIYTPVVSSSTSIYTPPVVSSSISIYTPPVVSSTSIYTPPVVSSTSIYTPPVVSSTSIYTPPLASSTSIYTPRVESSSSSIYTPPVISSSTSIYTPPVISSSSIYTPPVVSSSTSIYTPSTISSSTRIYTPPTISSSTSIYTPPVISSTSTYTSATSTVLQSSSSSSKSSSPSTPSLSSSTGISFSSASSQTTPLTPSYKSSKSSITSVITSPSASLTTFSTLTTKATSVTVCTSVLPAPTCEYACGKWCSKPLPVFNDDTACAKAVSSCILQVADCFFSNPWPESLQCFEFAGWCKNIKSYCSTCNGNNCNKGGCLSQYPPKKSPTVAPTPVVICTTAAPTTATSSRAPSTTTLVIPPTVTNVCVLPTGGPTSGYAAGSCVGNIHPPVLTCNDQLSDWGHNPFKLYSRKDSSACNSYPRASVPQACVDACNAQYDACTNVYAQSCKGKIQFRDQDSYYSATTKCKNQYADCLAVNKHLVVRGDRCGVFNGGWY